MVYEYVLAQELNRCCNATNETNKTISANANKAKLENERLGRAHNGSRNNDKDQP